ncbi:MAG: hypothetical protein EA402_13435 [Planctomycetota bacterium]|nr:MAG: hypothetical protein EA402_13435 [Planctomycetota bacterium]
MFQDLGNAVSVTVLVLLLALAVAVALRVRGWRRAGRGVMMVSLLGAVPGCSLLLFSTEATRYGDFHYSHHQHIRDSRVRNWIPARATDLRIRSFSVGVEAEYALALSELLVHVEQNYERLAHYRAYGDSRDFVRDLHDFRALRQALENLEATDWLDPVTIEGPRAFNGAGSTYEFMPEAERVRQRSNYW